VEASLALPGLEGLAEPFAGDCPRCHVPVLAVELAGREVVLELAEVMPEHPCPLCAQVAARGHTRSGCIRCSDTGVIGDPLPLRGVVLDVVTFEVRPYRAGDDLTRLRGEGEWWAVHLFHACIVG
jgi:hypothetical protein